MTAVFGDTSAFLALLSASDENHAPAALAFEKLRAREAQLVSSSYVLVETCALLARRFGLTAVRSFRADFAPLLDVVWVGAATHDAALDLLLERGTRSFSLVDAVSFLTMRQRGLVDAFAFDARFEKEGFSLVR